jgi:hypothetical protein
MNRQRQNPLSSGAIEHFALPNGLEKIDPDRMLSDLVGEESREDLPPFTAPFNGATQAAARRFS